MSNEQACIFPLCSEKVERDEFCVDHTKIKIMTSVQLALLPDDLLIEGDFETREVYLNGEILSPNKSQRVWNHSPDGFNWGYAGSGPAQLALAILLNYLAENDAVRYHQDFKVSIVAGWPQADIKERINLREILKNLIQ